MLGWEVVEVAASGTFGTVCVAMDLATGSLDAIKVLRGEHLRRPRVLARTRDEAAMLKQLDHPGIVKVRDLVELDGRPVLVMEWVRGLSVERVLEAHGTLPTGPALAITARVANALNAAWLHPSPITGTPLRVIHRDVKPSNVIVSVVGEVKLVDFGIAHAEIAGKHANTQSVVLGARGYVAPERLDGHDDHPSSDTYSLGICLAEMLTGRHPELSLHRGHHDEALERHLSAIRPAGVAPADIAGLRELVGQMCAYDAAARPNHAQTVVAIDAFLERSHIPHDLQTYADNAVWPLFLVRSRVALVDHPDHADLAFLDRALRPGLARAAPDVDGQLAHLLSRNLWVDDPSDLHRTLALNPHATARPFLNALPSAPGLWRRLAGTTPSEVRRVVALLRILARWISPEVRQRVTQLTHHSSTDIAEAARRLLREDP